MIMSWLSVYILAVFLVMRKANALISLVSAE